MKQKLYTLALAACAALFPAAASANTNQVSIFDNLNFTPNNRVEFVKESNEMMKAAPGVPFISETVQTRTNSTYRYGGYYWGSGVQWNGLTMYGNDIIDYLPDLDVVVYKNIDYDWTYNQKITKAETSLDIKVYDQNGTRLVDSLDVFKDESGMSVWGITKVINHDPANKDIRKCSFLYYSSIHFPVGSDGMSQGHAAYVSKNNELKVFSGKGNFKPAEGYEFDIFEFIGVTPKKNENFNFYSSVDFRAIQGSGKAEVQDNILIGDMTSGSLNVEFVPQFEGTFVLPDQPGTIVKSKAVMDDYDGKLYYFTVSPFKEPKEDSETRVPGVAVSEDDGYSFEGGFEKMPKEVIDKFLKDNNLVPPELTSVDDVERWFVSFYNLDFIVYGPNKMSAVTQMILKNLQTNEFMGTYMVEIIKDGANWSMKIVDDFTCVAMNPQTNTYTLSLRYIDILTVENQGEKDPVPGVDYAIITSTSPRNHEIELATTKDGKYLVAKWIEQTYDDKIRINGRKYYDTSAISTNLYDVYSRNSNGVYEPNQLDGVYSNQIMVSYREINGGNWSKPVNLTLGYKPNYYLHTHMPKVIPSLNNIPVFYTFGFDIDEETMNPDARDSEMWKKNMVQFKKLPEMARRTFYTVARSFAYGNFNIEAFDNVEEQIIPAENGIGVFPNPATSEMTIKIDSETSATVEIYNMLGAKIMSFNGVISAVTADVSSLANGMYMVKVIENGNVRSSSFTIAR